MESYKFLIWDISEIPPLNPRPLIKYQIWIGLYHLGTGYDMPKEPEMVAEVEATSFKAACYLYELESAINSLKSAMKCCSETGNRNDCHIEDIHFGKLYYDPNNNSNGWTGKYYESREQALESF